MQIGEDAVGAIAHNSRRDGGGALNEQAGIPIGTDLNSRKNCRKNLGRSSVRINSADSGRISLAADVRAIHSEEVKQFDRPAAVGSQLSAV